MQCAQELCSVVVVVAIADSADVAASKYILP